jgi:hypothetical protein
MSVKMVDLINPKIAIQMDYMMIDQWILSYKICLTNPNSLLIMEVVDMSLFLVPY